MEPLVSAMPAYRRRSPAEMELLEGDRSAAFGASVDAMRQATDSAGYRRAVMGDELTFVPGRGYVPIRDVAAEWAMSQGFPVGPQPQELEYETTGLGRALNAFDALGSTAEGVLAGLSSDTERSQGFLDPVMQGLSRFGNPDADMAAVHERLYRDRGGNPMTGVNRLVAGEVLNPWQALTPPRLMRPAGIRTELLDPEGNVIRRLLDARPAPRLGLPAPQY